MTLPPEPPIGCEVVDKHGVRWEHVDGTYGNHYWIRVRAAPARVDRRRHAKRRGSRGAAASDLGGPGGLDRPCP